MRGKEILDKEIRKLRRVWRGFAKKDLILKLMERCRVYSSPEELLAAIGYGDITLTQLNKILKEELDNILQKIKGKEPEEKTKDKSKEKESIALTYDGEAVVQVKGISNLAVRIARCCNPLPGEDIIGYITQGRGVSVHRVTCHNFKYFSRNKERLLEVKWLAEKKKTFPVRLLINGWDRPGLLNDITSYLREEKINSTSLTAYTRGVGEAVFKISIEIKDFNQLENIMKTINAIQGIVNTKRIFELKD